ncbi:hypothetical protein MMC25_001336 [Agyrium rufum]|nr:hypothetical protein [Agyrium rufum]
MDQSTTQLVAQVHFVPKLPTLALEHVELHLEDVVCKRSMIHLAFKQLPTWENAVAEFEALSQFIVITSHIGCNTVDERTAYLVSAFAANASERTATLSVERLAWSSAFQTMRVEFGSSLDSSNWDFRRHDVLRKRQASEASSTVASTSTYSYPFSAVSSPTATAALDLNLNHQLINEPLASFSATQKQANGTLSATTKESLSVACKNCTMTGSIDLVYGYFETNGSQSSGNQTDDIIDFFKHGYVEIKANGLTASIELESIIDTSETLAFVGHLTGVPIPLSPFTIPGIANVGPYFDAQVYGSLVIDAKLAFSYGFDLSVPDGSTVLLNFADISNSTSSGFHRTTVNAVPFQAGLPQISLNASIGFKPTLGIGIDIFDGLSDATAAIYLDVPKVTVDVVPVKQVNQNCDTPSKNSTTDAILDYVFDDLLNIIPSIEIGVGADYNIKIEGICNTWANSTGWVATSYALPTNCLQFDAAAKTFVAATVPASVSAALLASATSSGSSGGGPGGSPFSSLVSGPHLSAGAIVGISLASAIGVAVLGMVLLFLKQKHRQRLSGNAIEKKRILDTPVIPENDDRVFLQPAHEMTPLYKDDVKPLEKRTTIEISPVLPSP